MPGTLEKKREDAGPVTRSNPPAGGVFRRLLVVLDDSAAADAAVGLAREWARTFGAEARFVRVEERPGGPGRDHGPGDPSVGPTRVVAHGRTLRARNRSLVEGITGAAATFGADVVVLGCDRRRLASRRLCASLRERLVRATELPVMVAQATAADVNTEDRRGPTAEATRRSRYAHV